jgi:hypothetical protein
MKKIVAHYDFFMLTAVISTGRMGLKSNNMKLAMNYPSLLLIEAVFAGQNSRQAI